jgi:peroxiredoxin
MTKNLAAPSIQAKSINDQVINLSGFYGKKVLIKFHRFSGCPLARCQIQELIERQDELNDAGIETVVLLHSSKEKILSNFREVPGLHIIADPEKKIYRQYHSEFSWGKLFSISSWRETFKSFFKGYFPQFNRFEGGIIAVPSDFLLDKKGKIADFHYGKHFGDSWTVQDIIRKASQITE